MTLADYSLSNVAFDQADKWKNTLKQLVAACNETEALGAMIPQLEEFIYVSRSKFVYQTIANTIDDIMCIIFFVSFIPESWLATTIFASLNSVAYTFHVLACYR